MTRAALTGIGAAFAVVMLINTAVGLLDLGLRLGDWISP